MSNILKFVLIFLILLNGLICTILSLEIRGIYIHWGHIYECRGYEKTWIDIAMLVGWILILMLYVYHYFYFYRCKRGLSKVAFLFSLILNLLMVIVFDIFYLKVDWNVAFQLDEFIIMMMINLAMLLNSVIILLLRRIEFSQS